MKATLRTSTVGLLALLALGGAAQASDAGVTIRVSDYRFIGDDRFSGGDHFDRAMVEFANRYADQNERDWAALRAAADSGRIRVELEVG